VLSRSTERVDREIKVPLYTRAGVGWLWLVDPEARRAEILRSAAGQMELVEMVEGDVRRALPPFSSVVDTSRWWVTRPDGLTGPG
jgi:Uma2 family endonuclease